MLPALIGLVRLADQLPVPLDRGFLLGVLFFELVDLDQEVLVLARCFER